MDKYRSTVNPLTIIVNVLLYIILLVIVYFKSNDFFPYLLVLVFLFASFSTWKFLSYKYVLDNKGLIINHKFKRLLILYKDIKYVEINSTETGMIYGYGIKRLLISTGKGIENYYLITPEHEKEFIENLEKRVNMVKKAQTKKR